jgi:hypothetical protein
MDTPRLESQTEEARLQRWGARIRDELEQVKALPENFSERSRRLKVLRLESRQYLEALLAADQLSAEAFDRETGRLEQVYDELLRSDFDDHVAAMRYAAKGRQARAERLSQASLEQAPLDPAPTLADDRELPSTEVPDWAPEPGLYDFDRR